jgi:azurin
MEQSISRRRFITLLGAGVGSTTVLAACSGGGGEPQPTAPTAPPVPGPAAGSGGDVTLEIGSLGDDSKFDKEQLEVPAGSRITLVFRNTAKPESNKLFNWVLTRPGTHLRVVNAGTNAGEASGYVAPNDENVIAATKLIKGGESDQITFDAPPPGEYTYVSTVPGYYTRMRGVLTVK